LIARKVASSRSQLAASSPFVRRGDAAVETREVVEFLRRDVVVDDLFQVVDVLLREVVGDAVTVEFGPLPRTGVPPEQFARCALVGEPLPVHHLIGDPSRLVGPLGEYVVDGLLIECLVGGHGNVSAIDGRSECCASTD
jgi:hypothetical protein